MRGRKLLELIHKIVWGPWLMVLFLAVGLLYTVRSRCFQIRGLLIWWKATVGSFFAGKGETGAVSRKEQIKTACTALAATVGTGNIVGVTAAIMAGGPGALFWMWVSAAIGMMTAYGEVYLGIASRIKRQDGCLCGPFVYLEKLAGMPALAVIYGILCLLCSLGMGSMVQANSLVETAAYSFHVPRLLAAVLLGLLTASIICGGQKSIAGAASALVPFSAGIYIFFSVIVIFLCRRNLPSVLKEIFEQAVSPASAVGFGVGQAMRYGLARGVFSNEAGLGSMAVLHGDSPGENPCLQGMWAMFEVFFDTIVVCTLTGIAVLCGLKQAGEGRNLSGAALTSWVFSCYLGKMGECIISVSLILFAFATIIAWYYLGSQALFYLNGKRKGGKKAARLYQFLYLAAVFGGSLAAMGKVWMVSDILNGLMAVPNLTALFLLSGLVRFPDTDRRSSGSVLSSSFIR